MDSTNENVEPRIAFCAFDLQINQLSANETLAAQSNSLSILGSNLGSWVGDCLPVERREVTVPIALPLSNT